MANGRVNVGGNGGGNINLYAQPTEPTKKEGIWIKTGTAKTNIINDLDLWFANSWNNPALKAYADVPYNAKSKTVCAVGTDIYVMGGFNDYNGVVINKSMWKYDTINNYWTKMSDYPFSISFAYNYFHSTVIGTDIYIVTNDGKCNKFNTLNNTWTAMITNTFMDSQAQNGTYVDITAVGTDIYCFWTASYGTNKPYIYKFETIQNKWTQIASYDTGLAHQYGVVVKTIGTDIYMFYAGGQSDTVGLAVKKFNVATNSITKVSDVPATSGNGITIAMPNTVVGVNVHLTHANLQHYVYNTTNNTWSLMGSPTPIKVMNMVYVNGNITAFDENVQYNVKDSPSKNYRFNFTSKVYGDGTVILYRIKNYLGLYQAELVSLPPNIFTGVNNRILTGFDNVYMYANGTLNENLPTYYGDGTKWVQFKGF